MPRQATKTALSKKQQIEFMAEQYAREFNSPTPKLSEVAVKYLGYKEPKEAIRAANKCKLPIPAFRMGSQKTEYLVSAIAMAEHVFNKSERARLDHFNMQSATV